MTTFDTFFKEIAEEKEERRKYGWTMEELREYAVDSGCFSAEEVEDIEMQNRPQMMEVSVQYSPKDVLVTAETLTRAVDTLEKAIAVKDDPEEYMLPEEQIECPECGSACDIEHTEHDDVTVYCEQCDVKGEVSTFALFSHPWDASVRPTSNIDSTYDCEFCDGEHVMIEPVESIFSEEDFEPTIENGAYAETPGSVNCPCGYSWDLYDFDWSDGVENECPECSRVYTFSVFDPNQN